MLGGKTAEKEVPAEKSESGRDSGTDDSAAGKRTRGDDGKSKTSKDGGDSKEDEPAEGEDGPQKRINKAVRKQREAERKAEQLEREIAELKKSGGKTSEEKKDEKPKADPGEPKKPKQDDFSTYEDFIDALTDYKADLRDFQREKKEKERKAAEANQEFTKAWEKKRDAAREKFSDFDEVMEDAGDTPISRVMHSIINESDIGPQLGYYLATHPDEAAAIRDMKQYAAVRAMAKIEDKLTDSEKPAEDKKQAKKELPKPPRNVGGNATPKEPKLDDKDIDFGAFKRIARAHLNRQR